MAGSRPVGKQESNTGLLGEARCLLRQGRITIDLPAGILHALCGGFLHSRQELEPPEADQLPVDRGLRVEGDVS